MRVLPVRKLFLCRNHELWSTRNCSWYLWRFMTSEIWYITGRKWPTQLQSLLCFRPNFWQGKYWKTEGRETEERRGYTIERRETRRKRRKEKKNLSKYLKIRVAKEEKEIKSTTRKANRETIICAKERTEKVSRLLSGIIHGIIHARSQYCTQPVRFRSTFKRWFVVLKNHHFNLKMK